ncbi:MAG: hypothetical protein K5669_05085 [Lachnospiraceae bacterium]|nr:hypothetical protein [Lachnospiraceae bacterium]
MSAVGMESARSHMTANFSYRRFEETEPLSAFSGNSFGESLFGNSSLSGGLDQKEEPKKSNMITTEELFELRQRTESLRNNYTQRSEEATTAETLRYSSVMYILRLLFGDDEDTLKRLESIYGEKSSSGSGISDGYFGGTADVSSAGVSAADLLTADASEMMQRPLKQITYMATDCYSEYEETSFSAKGIVRTADGRELDFNIDVSMSRSFVRETSRSLNLSFVTTCDPLVINLDSNPATVSDQKIRFDIDGDGELDTVNSLGPGSGYLALDKNGDGKINDGTELFGTKSGDGFKDLSLYDEDGNGWIDEDDDIWSKLKIWVTDEKGRSKLYSLSEAGVGALCLNATETQFSDTDDDNNAKAYIRSTGIFLYENGFAGTLQHLDLVKYEQNA